MHLANLKDYGSFLTIPSLPMDRRQEPRSMQLFCLQATAGRSVTEGREQCSIIQRIQLWRRNRHRPPPSLSYIHAAVDVS